MDRRPVCVPGSIQRRGLGDGDRAGPARLQGLRLVSNLVQTAPTVLRQARKGPVGRIGDLQRPGSGRRPRGLRQRETHRRRRNLSARVRGRTEGQSPTQGSVRQPGARGLEPARSPSLRPRRQRRLSGRGSLPHELLSGVRFRRSVGVPSGGRSRLLRRRARPAAFRLGLRPVSRVQPGAGGGGTVRARPQAAAPGFVSEDEGRRTIWWWI